MTSFARARLQAAVSAHVARLALRAYPKPADAWRAFWGLTAEDRAWSEKAGRHVPVREGERWRFAPHTPAWPSPAFDRWVLAHLDRAVPCGAPGPWLDLVLLSVTARCPLHCAHCSAAGELGHHEPRTLSELQASVDLLQAHGVGQLQFTGGEPMARFDDLVHLIGHTQPTTETWINTSGVGLDDRRAERLRQAGLGGVWLSVDAVEPARHDARRGHEGAWVAARDAAAACRRAGLPLGLSWVPEPGTVDRAALEAYSAMAGAWGAFAVRVIEPKASGRWAGRSVGPSEGERRALTEWHDERQWRPDGRMWIVDTVLAERVGCLFRGLRAAYVDVDGDLRSCPFCGAKAGPLTDYEGALARLRARSCDAYAAGVAP